MCAIRHKRYAVKCSPTERPRVFTFPPIVVVMRQATNNVLPCASVIRARERSAIIVIIIWNRPKKLCKYFDPQAKWYVKRPLSTPLFVFLSLALGVVQQHLRFTSSAHGECQTKRTHFITNSSFAHLPDVVFNGQRPSVSFGFKMTA